MKDKSFKEKHIQQLIDIVEEDLVGSLEIAKNLGNSCINIPVMFETLDNLEKLYKERDAYRLREDV